MLWVRGLLFTLFVPFMAGVMVPLWLVDGHETRRGTLWGWVPIAIGAGCYLLSLLKFLLAGGTPSIYFARPLRFVLGEEPREVVERGLYAYTRNPMYVGVLTAIQGFALLLGSWEVALYGVLFAVWLHFVVTRIEEPHLRQERGAVYEEYCRRVPRWFWPLK